jgi:hypothetical protein
MKTRSFFARCALLLGLSLMIAFACQKLEFDEPDATAAAHETSKNPNVFNVGGGDAISPRSDEPTPTILGNPRVNPYTVQKMTEAWNNLNGTNLPTLPATHRYVKFMPATLEQFKKLNETELVLFDYPLEYEIIQMGDYYDDPAVPEGGIPPLYTVVEANAGFPTTIPHEIKAELLLAPGDSYLVKEAFRLTGNNYVVSYVGSGSAGSGRPEPDPECKPGCPNYPCCLEPDIFCDDVPCVTDPNQGCQPGSANWPECLGGGGGGGSSEFTQNDCGCMVFSDMRKPGGCIKVLDTQLPGNATVGGASVHLEGIKQVKVIFKDDWFTTSSTFTDMNGCWKINRRHSGRAWMWVEFKSSRTVVRGQRFGLGWNYWELSAPVKDYVGVIAGPVFNNIQLNYFPANDNEGNSKRYWYAATANNALHDYDGFAQQDGIPVPPGQTVILLTNLEGSAAAPMLARMPQVAIQLQANIPAFPFDMFEIFGIDVTIGTPPLPANFSVSLLLQPGVIPDIVYNYGDENGEASDEIKETFYHEFAHASHFVGLNNNSYWQANMNYVIDNAVTGNNSPYGTRGTPGFERCAIIEMWGYHLGPQYADRKYGMFHSRTTSSIPSFIELRRWKYQKESFVPDFLGSSDLDSWIPEGLCLDLIDDNVLNPQGVNEGLGPGGDPIKGFSTSSFFNAISTNSPTKLTDVESNLQGALPPGVSTADLRAMLVRYGY